MELINNTTKTLKDDLSVEIKKAVKCLSQRLAFLYMLFKN